MQVLEGFLVEGHHVGTDLAHLHVVVAHPLHQVFGENKRDGRAQQREHGKRRIVIQDEKQRGEKLHQAGDEVGDPAEHTLGHGVHVPGEAVEQIPGMEFGDLLPPGMEHGGKHLTADLLVHADLDLRGNAACEGIRADAEQIHAHIAHGRRHDEAAVVARDGVDDVFRDDARAEPHARAEHAEEDIPDHRALVAHAAAVDPLHLREHLAQHALAQAPHGMAQKRFHACASPHTARRRSATACSSGRQESRNDAALRKAGAERLHEQGGAGRIPGRVKHMRRERGERFLRPERMQAVFRRLAEQHERAQRHAAVHGIGRGAAPRRAPRQYTTAARHGFKQHLIPIQDMRAGMLLPKARLRRLAPRRKAPGRPRPPPHTPRARRAAARRPALQNRNKSR